MTSTTGLSFAQPPATRVPSLIDRFNNHLHPAIIHSMKLQDLAYRYRNSVDYIVPCRSRLFSLVMVKGTVAIGVIVDKPNFDSNAATQELFYLGKSLGCVIKSTRFIQLKSDIMGDLHPVSKVETATPVFAGQHTRNKEGTAYRPLVTEITGSDSFLSLEKFITKPDTSVCPDCNTYRSLSGACMC